MEFTVWIFATCSSLAALFWSAKFYRQMMAADEGTPLMIEIAASVREGAGAYLRQQNKWVAIVFIAVAAMLASVAWTTGIFHWLLPIAFLVGGGLSGFCGWFGMRTATAAGGRTAAAATHSLSRGLQVAFRSGAVMGLIVVGTGLLSICFWWALLQFVIPNFGGQTISLRTLSVTMLSFGMGASAQALFARVGGGIFTKAADVGADLVGKVEEDLREDSPRNPATIADNVGDNVGDVAGMGADLYESYTGSILAASALGVAAMANPVIFGGDAEQTLAPEIVRQSAVAAFVLPMAIAAVGILLSIAGIYQVKTDDDSSDQSLLHVLSKGISRSTWMVAVAATVLSILIMPSIPSATFLGFIPGVAFSVVIGLLAGWAIGAWTERATSDEYSATRKLAEQAESGSATIIIGGIADGMLSTWVPVAVICGAMLLAFNFACGFNHDTSHFALGLYGVGIAAVGMLSTLGITLATDAYGPIADNAGGNAEMSGLDEVVRERTDALDSLGNTTAATGKGFAIGSAALTALALLAAYIESIREGYIRWGNSLSNSINVSEISIPGLIVDQAGDVVQTMLVMPDGSRVDVATASLQDFLIYFDATLMNPSVLIGLFLGAMSAFVFCALTMKSVGRAAQSMVTEVRRQFAENPGILDGSVKPDTARPIEISTAMAQREMILPSLLGLLMPIAVGLLLGVAGVLGLLTGCLTTGFCLAIFMANAGGSWDNAKKYIEAGHHGGKGSDAHKAAVVGDTVGDPFKDTSGPALNILIKLMSMVSVVVAGLIIRYSL